MKNSHRGAIFGGSFDPVHHAHLAIINQALLTLQLDELIVLPNMRNPFKSPTIAPSSLRLSWLHRACETIVNVTVSDFEINQHRSVYAIESVLHFLPDFDTLYFIIGADNLPSLHQWHRFDELNALITWVVCSRDNINIPASMIQLQIDMPISSTELRDLSRHDFLFDEMANYYKEHLAKPNRQH